MPISSIARILATKSAFAALGEVAVQLVGAEPDAEAHAQTAAVRRQIGQLDEGSRWVWFAPASPQEGIGLGRVVEP
jgi:hypothetical protein